jgi:tRNA-specific 2-thiouridylase
VTARVRHRGAEIPATVTPLEDGAARVDFDEPVRAVTPGQSCVFYDGDVVVGGGAIRRAEG